MSDYRVIAFGELLWDVLPGGKLLGGAPGNFAYRVGSLGVSAGLVSRVGADADGREIVSRLKEIGVPTGLIQTDPVRPTGTVDVRLTADRNANYTINRDVAYDFIEVTPAALAAAAACELLCFGTLAQRSPGSRETLYALLAAAPRAVKLLDINLRGECYSRETVSESLRRADVLKLNRDEVRDLQGLLSLPDEPVEAFAGRVLDAYGLTSCLVTAGEEGAQGFGKDGESVHTPGYRVRVADTIGAGDAFTAGFAYKLLSGATLGECCEFGNRLGALAASRSGGMAPIPWEEIESFPGRAA